MKLKHASLRFSAMILMSLPLFSGCTFVGEPINSGLTRLNRNMSGAPSTGKGAQPEMVGKPFSKETQAIVDSGFIRAEDMEYFQETGYIPPNGLVSSGGLTDGSGVNLFFGTLGVVTGDAFMATDLASVRAHVVKYFESGFFVFPASETEKMIDAVCKKQQESSQGKCTINKETAKYNFIYSIGKEKYRTLGPGIPLGLAKTVADQIRNVIIFEGVKVRDNRLVSYTLNVDGKKISPALGECFGGGVIVDGKRTIPVEFSGCNIFEENEKPQK